MLETMTAQVSELLGSYVPNLLGGLGVLLIGWIVAMIAAALVRSALHRTSLDDRLAHWLFGPEAMKNVSVEKIAGRLVFAVVMLFVLVAFFQALQLTVVTGPLNALLERLAAFAPRILGAGLVLLIAGVAATVVRSVVARGLTWVRFDERVGTGRPDDSPMSRSVADALYWLVLLLFLPGILGALQLEGLLVPVQNLTATILGFLPNMLAASLIFLLGWFVATLVRRIVTNLLAAIGVDGIAERAGLGAVLGTMTLSGVLGLVVYVLILLPVLVAGLEALELDAVTQPASTVLAQILSVIPALLGAVLVFGVAHVVGRIVAGLLTRVLTTAGFDRLLEQLGLGARTTGAVTPSAVVGTLAWVAMLVFAAIEVSELFGFAIVANLITTFLLLVGRVALGLVVLGVGLYLAGLAARNIAASTVTQAGLLAVAARVGILGLASAMALRQMGLANEIIVIAFGLVVGSIAVAAAIAFGVGARDVAGRLVEDWTSKLRK